MSESTNDSSKIPSNEEVVDEITKNFTENLSISSKINQDKEPNHSVPSDFENSDNEEVNSTKADDFIDEERLESLEATLTDEEKLVRHKEALEFKRQGNEGFKLENYLESITLYSEGLKICPLKFSSDRAILYANRGASKAKLDRKENAIEDCTKAIELNNTYVKAYLRRAKLYEEIDKLDESLADWKKIIELDSKNIEAHEAEIRLVPKINERNEKLKEEMLGKLKDLGNVILRPFGLSTDNFKLTQDPNTGGYSVNFSQGSK
ncbi:hypothetical protein ABEB36_003372 [Hypothenemus hampei]|uniref:Tetratricopeptide repeat protein 1 n=1 Tax=Hypothenemus hampei TaxID=57062 RepID=A0ABD1FCK1_HYPHA